MTRPSAQRQAGVESRVRDKLIVALDTPDLDTALHHVDRLGDPILWYKVGLQLFCASGRKAVQALSERGKKIFLDLKLHDIPATVERAILALEGLPVSLLTVHASGGPKMLSAAAAAARSLGSPPQLLGVTMLTSLDGTEIPALWNERTSLEEKVLGLARLAAESGIAGVVASPLELAALRRELPRPFLIVTPGVRSPGEATHDQKRTLSLPEAFAGGADYVVVGRPILEASDPAKVVASYDSAVAEHFYTERND